MEDHSCQSQSQSRRRCDSLPADNHRSSSKQRLRARRSICSRQLTPRLRRHLFNDQNVLRNFVNVYLNDEDIRHASGPDTPVKDGDTIMIVPSIAGGAVIESEVGQSLPELSNEEILRYSRHLIMPEVGMQGQRRLKAASVLMIGTGGLGAPVGMYLAAAGVGRIGIVDFDVVEESNLQRQIIHGTKDLGRRKIESARDRLRDINPHIEIETHETRLTSHNAMRLFRNYDIIVDGTDNFPTRYLVNDACVLSGKPNVYGSIFRFEGQASVFWAEKGACYRCLVSGAAAARAGAFVRGRRRARRVAGDRRCDPGKRNDQDHSRR